MAGNRPAIASTEPRLGGLRVQTSLYGQTVPVVYGRTRIPGNLVWYGGFKAERQEERSEAAKGGGSRPTRIYYAYSASVQMLLGEGPIAAVRTVYKGKQKFPGETVSVTAGTAVHTATVPASPHQVSVPVPSGWVATVRVTQRAELVTTGAEGATVYETYDRTLQAGTEYSVAAGVYTFAAALAGQVVTITFTTSAASASVNALAQLGLALAPGTPGQPVWQYLSTSFPAEAVPYSGFAYLRGQDYALTNAADVENHTFEVDGFLGSAASGDARPAPVIADMLTNTAYGVGWGSAYLADWSSFAAYCDAYGLLISPAFLEQRAARDWLSELLDSLNTDAAWTGRVLKLLPRGEEAAGSYTPTVTPVFDLGPDDYLAEDGQQPVRFVRSGLTDVPNIVRVEYANRARDYNYETVASEDEDSIVLNGQRPDKGLAWHWFCEAQAATNAAQLRRQRLSAVRGTYEFVLPWRFAELEVGDLVTLTEPELHLVREPVKVLEISEEGDDFAIVAEDFPIGHATAPIVAPQLGSGFRPDFNADPGLVAPPVFFEPPGGFTTTGLEVWIALSGQSGAAGQFWGGAEVYASLDGGTSYKLVGRVDQGARFGTLTAPLAAGTSGVLDVTLQGRGGQLRSVSAAEADALATLAFVGDTSSGEFVAFQGAALTAANTYRLTGLRRARYGTTDQAAASGARFVYIDGAIGMSGPLAADMIGREIRFKFCAFNVFGGGLQSLAAVPEYSYTLTGRFRDQAVVAQSANLLTNPTYDRGVATWVPYFIGTPAATTLIERRTDAPNFVPGSPSSALISIPSGATGAGFGAGMHSLDISVQPGRRYVAYASLIGADVSPMVAVQFFSANLTLITTVGGSVVPARTFATAASQWGTASAYGMSELFVDAPPGAAIARFTISTSGNWAATTGPFQARYIAVYQPFFGQVAPGVSDLPPWDPGGHNMVSTELLSPNSTSRLYFDSAEGVTMSELPNAQVCRVSFTAPSAGYVTATGTVSGSLEWADLPGTIPWAALGIDAYIGNIDAVPADPNVRIVDPGSSYRRMIEARSAGTYQGTGTTQTEFEVAAGELVTVFLNYLPVPLAGAVCQNAKLRVEYVYR